MKQFQLYLNFTQIVFDQTQFIHILSRFYQSFSKNFIQIMYEVLMELNHISHQFPGYFFGQNLAKKGSHAIWTINLEKKNSTKNEK